VVLLGFGGDFVARLDTVVVRPAPLSQSAAAAMVDELCGPAGSAGTTRRLGVRDEEAGSGAGTTHRLGVRGGEAGSDAGATPRLGVGGGEADGGGPPVPTGPLTAAVTSLGALVAAVPELEEIEINPLRAGPGGMLLALDVIVRGVGDAGTLAGAAVGGAPDHTPAVAVSADGQGGH
jgi:hypothetical protein